MTTIEQIFTYHPPKGDQIQRYEDIRIAAKEFATILMSKIPNSHESDFAFAKLKECVMWANASIAINECEPIAGKQPVSLPENEQSTEQ